MDATRVLLLISGLVTLCWSAKTECKPGLDGYTFVNDPEKRCYQYVYEPDLETTWSQARQYCQDRDGRLVNIRSESKQRLLESYLNLAENPYKPGPRYNAYDNKTWKGFDPNIWIGAVRESDGVTWTFDTYIQSRTSRSSVVLWFNYGDDPKEEAAKNAEKNRYSTDVCMVMRLTRKTEIRQIPSQNGTTSINITRLAYPWYMHQFCSDDERSQSLHPFMCEYDTYEYRSSSPEDWMYVIAILGAFIGIGFITCALYCLWDKMRSSYEALQASPY